ncbi:hypothetical protein O181_012641 [Austropuccinia psidii MF-1]|uniref:Uncharacterized protein n=1 Tax=Austropuccinia psidii MF-1 TaxID=1389203 RepID=A0A9Q3BY74_9BASI|nr:hypothetical protein [Austropuccinia psidii MF-1]
MFSKFFNFFSKPKIDRRRHGWKRITSDSDSPVSLTPLVPEQSPRAGLSETAVHKPLEGNVKNPACIAISFLVQGVHALFSRIEQETDSSDEFGIGHLAYSPQTAGVVTCRIFERSQWRICLKKLQGPDSAPHLASVRVGPSRYINRLGKRPGSGASSRPATAGKNNLCVSLSRVNANEDCSSSASLTTTITVAIREPGSVVQLGSVGGLDDRAEGCLWSHTEDFTFDNEHPTWRKLSYSAAIIRVIAECTNSNIRFLFSYIAAREVIGDTTCVGSTDALVQALDKPKLDLKIS